MLWQNTNNNKTYTHTLACLQTYSCCFLSPDEGIVYFFLQDSVQYAENKVLSSGGQTDRQMSIRRKGDGWEEIIQPSRSHASRRSGSQVTVLWNSSQRVKTHEGGRTRCDTCASSVTLRSTQQPGDCKLAAFHPHRVANDDERLFHLTETPSGT